MSKTTFYFTTFEVTGTLTTVLDFDPTRSPEERERELLENYIQTTDPVAEDQSGTWYFGAPDIQERYALGKFGKVYTEEPTTYDEELGDFIDDAAKSKDADYSMFIIDFEDNILIYNTKNRIGYQQFRKHFAKGFSETYGADLSIETKFIRNRDDIETVVEEKPVYEASFELEPSNPSNHPDWRDLDESIQEMLAKQLEILAKADEEKSLNMDEDLLKQAVKMAQTKYGIDYRIVYDDDGQVKTITKERDPIQTREEEPDTIGGLREMTRDLISYANSYVGDDD